MTANLFESGRREVLRWGGCLLIVGVVHAAGAVALLTTPERGEIADSTESPPIDFVSLPTMDAPPREIAPGIEQVQTEAAPAPSEAKPLPAQEVQPMEKPTPVRVREARLTEPKEVRPVNEEPLPIPDLPEIRDAEVSLATALPPPSASEEKIEEESEEKSEARLVPPMATASETTAPTAVSVDRASLVSWKRRLAMHLHRHKRYPPSAVARRQRGTAQVQFSVDRKGHVRSARLLHGSGHAVLDEEALALLRRAQPLPPPPADVPGAAFSFTVPVQFLPR